MAGSVRFPKKYRNFLSAVTLGLWRWRQNWFLLLIVWVGMLSAVMVTCAVPLISQVTTTAGLRSVLRSAPYAKEITVQNTSILPLDLPFLIDQEDRLIRSELDDYLGGLHSEMIGELALTEPFLGNDGNVQLRGHDLEQVKPHLRLLEGKFPAPCPEKTCDQQVEVLISPRTAQEMKLQTGATITMRINGTVNRDPFNAFLHVRVVGIMEPQHDDPYWHGASLDPVHYINPYRSYYPLLISQTTLIQAIKSLMNTSGSLEVQVPFHDLLYAELNPAKITIYDLDTLIENISYVGTAIERDYVDRVKTQRDIYGSVVSKSGYFSNLEYFRQRLSIVEIPLTIIGLQILALVLFFVSLIVLFLVEAQASTLAVLRSRGASGGQLVGSLLMQCSVLGILAFVAGPWLTLPVTGMLTTSLLSANSWDAIPAILGNFSRVWALVWPYALLAAILSVSSLALTLNRVLHSDVLELRREIARSTTRPLWQRLYLDVIAAVVALTGFGFSLYINSLNGTLDDSVNTFVSSPLALLGPSFLLLGLLLLSLRILPLGIRYASTLALKGRGATPMLAMAHMARSPQHLIRMMLLLSLAVAFTFVTLVLTNAQSSRSQNVANYQVGSDFSGSISRQSQLSYAQAQEHLSSISGVTAAVVGYQGVGMQDQRDTISYSCVDPALFGKVLLYPSERNHQELQPLLQQLIQQRSSLPEVVPALVDSNTMQRLRLHIGSVLELRDLLDQDSALTKFLVIGQVQYLPTPGGLIADFQTFAAYQQKQQYNVYVNHFWLRTRDDPASLQQVRSALGNAQLALSEIGDRRLIAETLSQDPLGLSLQGLLRIGMLIALLLALIGNLLLSWVSTSVRKMHFLILRALGTAPQQISQILLLEQIIIYLTAIILGIIFGCLFAYYMVPTLVFTSVPLGINGVQDQSIDLSAIQQALPVQINFPPSLLLALLVLVTICGIALVMMIRMVLRPSLTAALRLNED